MLDSTHSVGRRPYKDSVELAEIVSGIVREVMTKKKDVMAIAFIARYGRPLLAKNQESQIAGKEVRYGDYTDRYSYSRLSRRTTHLASQQEMGILSQRRNRIGSSDCAHPAADGTDLRRSRIR